MRCPFCDHADTQVKDSRNTEENKSVRRRRQCPHCNTRFTTFERSQLKELFVIKRSGVKKKFDREKIVNAVLTAMRKRQISDEKVNAIADHVMRELENSLAGEITTRKIGEMIMKDLAAIDQVAYIRFASVYKDFSSASDFAKFIGRMKS
ncbi:MAG: transcriptional regulator NrdR [Pseudomonadota bacterium]